MALKNRRTQKNKTNRRKQQSKRGGKRIGKNTKKSLRNKRQSRRRMRGGNVCDPEYGGECVDCPHPQKAQCEKELRRLNEAYWKALEYAR